MRRPRRTLVLLAALGIALAIAGQAAAYPYTVKGYVLDEGGRPVEGADVTLSGPSNPQALVLEDATDVNGYYSVTIGVNEPDSIVVSFQTASVHAESGRSFGDSSFYVPGNVTPGTWANVTVARPPENPLLDMTGLAVIGVIIGALVVLGLWMRARRKQQESNDGGPKPAEKPVRRRRGRKP
jgi:hypothetical protein